MCIAYYLPLSLPCEIQGREPLENSALAITFGTPWNLKI